MLTSDELELLSKTHPTIFAKKYLDWVAHPAQADMLNDRSQFKIISAGRRLGKSEMEAVDLLWYAFYHPNSYQFVISHSQDQAENVFAMAYQFVMNSPLLRGEIAKVVWNPFPEIIFNNGSRIYARSTSYDGKYLRGYKAHRVLIDEAAYNKEKVIKNVVMPMLTDYNGDLILISTPLGRNFFYDMWQRGNPDSKDKLANYRSWKFESKCNPHLSHAFIDNMKNEMLDIEFRTEYLAEFIDDEICVFKWEYINDACEDYDESFENEAGHNYYIGVDIARVHDWTTLTVLDGTNPRACKVVYTERFNNKPYEYVFDRVVALNYQFHPMKILIDETGVGAGVTEQVCQVLPQAEGFTFSMASKISLINTLKLGLEQHRFKMSRKNDTYINELKYYQYEWDHDKGIAGNIKMGAPQGKFDDCVISLALAFQCIAIPTEVACFGIEHKKDDDWITVAGNNIIPINSNVPDIITVI